jgi:hypothetical protein
MQDLPVFIVSGMIDDDTAYIEVVVADNIREAVDTADEKYGSGCKTIYTPENCPNELWEIVEEAVFNGGGSFIENNSEWC